MSAASFFARNEGGADRAVRIVLGVALLALAFTGKTAWGYLGVVPLATGLLGTCPLYSVFGFSTCPIANR